MSEHQETAAHDTAEADDRFQGKIEFFDLAGADGRLRFSPNCWAVRLMLAHKNLPVADRPWRFVEKAAIADAGTHAVPVIRDHVRGDGCWVHDRWQIALYLDQAYADRPPLLLPGEAGRAHGLMIKQWGDRAMLGPLSRLIIMDIFNLLHEGDKDYFRQTREQRLGSKLEAFHDPSEANLVALSKALNPLRDTLKFHDFLHGAAPGFADYVSYGWLHWAHVCSPLRLFAADDPVEHWCRRMRGLYGGLAGASPLAHGGHGGA